MNNWIKFDVNDKSTWPNEKYDEHIFATDGIYTYVCVFDNLYKFIDRPGIHDDGPPENYPNTTHWMPIELPKPPETEGE